MKKLSLALAVAAISQFSALADGLSVMNGTDGAKGIRIIENQTLL